MGIAQRINISAKTHAATGTGSTRQLKDAPLIESRNAPGTKERHERERRTTSELAGLWGKRGR